MKPAAKIAIIGCVSVVVLVVIVIIGGAWFVQSSGIMDQAKAGRTAGENEGKAMGESQCLEVALGKSGSMDVAEQVRNGVWLGGCLQTSRFEPAFCDGVPPQEEFRRSLEWQRERCRKAGQEKKPGCPSVFQQVQVYCQAGARMAKAPQTVPR